MAEVRQQSPGTEFWSSLMLAHTPGLGRRGCKRLLDHYGSAGRAAQTPEEWDSLQIAERNVADNFRQEKWRDRALREWELAQSADMAFLTYSDPDYPARLRHIPDPPPYLYYQGNADLLRAPCVAVVGSRICSSVGKAITADISHELASRGICVVSGFAWGTDRIAHQNAMDQLGGTAAVLGTGLDLIYPARNKDLWQALSSKGLILTEFAPGTRPEAHHFPRRNRIISGLCLGVLVSEAAEQSGGLITAQFALDQGREVFAVPGSPRQRTYSGCNALIKRGAVLVRSAEDILREIGPMLEEWIPGNTSDDSPLSQDSQEHPGEAVPVDLSDLEGELVRAMDSGEPLHIDTLTRRLNWSSSHTSQTLLSLELKGVVSRQNGMHYTLLR